MDRFPNGFRHLFDSRAGVGNHLAARWLFLRALGLVYFSAFFALLFQIRGLIGASGVLPVGRYLQQLQPLGPARVFYAPSLLWIVHSDAALMALVVTGMVAAALVVANILPRVALLLCFLCFLSFVGVSQDFGQYQSDGMLLEAGFLALFLAPGGLSPGWGRTSLPIRAALWLLLWEWFRIYVQSGVVKLQSGDPTWRNLTAMYEYYQNGPLPTWVGWYLQHLPHWFHIATAALTLLMELVFVWLVFAPRRFRIALFWIVTLWQAGVIVTANYAFLNYLVLILGFLLLDDAYLSFFVPPRWRKELLHEDRSTLLHDAKAQTDDGSAPAWRLIPGIVSTLLLCWVGYVTTAELLLMFLPRVPLPQFPIALAEPFRIANQYGLFANMTPHRFEIEFQGSDDGQTWSPYLFRYKPQDVRERPAIYAPYQPRFDWNLWFASLGPWQQSPIVPLTEERLLAGDADTLRLFRTNPFGTRPPHMVRAVLWQYWFSTPAQKHASGVWWTRRLLGTFAPTLTRLPDQRYRIVSHAELSGPPTE
jgi:hypothetical protein